MTIDELLDRESIRVLIATYNISGDRGRVDALAATFAEDGIIEFSGERTQGPAAIAARLGAGDAGGRVAVTRHHIATSLVEIDGDTATARTYFMVLTDIGPDHHGVYIDRLIRTASGWRFAHRLVRIDWQAQDSSYSPLHVRGRPPG